MQKIIFVFAILFLFFTQSYQIDKIDSDLTFEQKGPKPLNFKISNAALTINVKVDKAKNRNSYALLATCKATNFYPAGKQNYSITFYRKTDQDSKQLLGQYKVFGKFFLLTKKLIIY